MDSGPLAKPGVDSGNDAVTGRIGAGYLPLEYNGRQGNRDVAWFRGPAIPCQESSQTKWPEDAKSSDAYLRVVEPGSVTDTTLAAAYELGRLTMLADRNASARLVAAKHRLARGNAASLASAQKRQRIQADSAAQSYPPDLLDWFGDLRALRSVPFSYLVPDETMLPLNSIRYFQLDREWLSAMARGAWSVGYVCGLGAKCNLPAELDFNGNVSGLLVRSSVLREWPRMKVSAFSETNEPLPCIQNEALSPDLWLLLFEGTMGSWSFRLPHEHPHFGFSKDDEGSFKDLGPSRFAITGKYNDNTTVKVPISQDAIVEQTVNLTQLRKTISGALFSNATEVLPTVEFEFASPTTLPLLSGTVEVPSGTKRLLDGTFLLPDRTKVLEDGTKVFPNGTKVFANGTKVLPDGTEEAPDDSDDETIETDGTRVLLDGTKVRRDGTKVLRNGNTVLPDGTTVLPDGTAVSWDGTTVSPNAIRLQKDGTKLLGPAAFALLMMEQSHSITFNITPGSKPIQ
jgi:hypothetical protein